MAKPDLILLVLDESQTLQLLDRALRSANYSTAIVHDKAGLDRALQEFSPALIVLGEKLADAGGISLAEDLLERFPTLPILLFAERDSLQLVKEALRVGVIGYVYPPLKIGDIVGVIQSSLKRAHRTGDWVRREVKRTTASLEKRVSELETMVKLGRNIIGSLDLDSVLSNVVSAAVELTGAEDGMLLMLDGSGEQLYLQAGHNLPKDVLNSFHLPVSDSIVGEVVRESKRIVLNEASPREIAKGYAVRSLICVPLRLQDRPVGALCVDNRQQQQPFSDHNALLVSVLADYATIAMENARLYQLSEMERAKFEAAFSSMENGMVVLDGKQNILLVNQAACDIFHLDSDKMQGKPVLDVIIHPDLHNLLTRTGDEVLKYHEINFDDGRVFNAQYTPIPGFGSAITMQDITYLKELDRLKNDFVHTVSHDLRSPLTAVMGYTELLERSEPLTNTQHEFVRRIQSSVGNITTLVNDLLDLGRIEAGYDTLRETVQLEAVLRYTLDTFEPQIADKEINLHVETSPTLPSVRGNPIRLRQMLDNLIGNAVKYTPPNGDIWIAMLVEDQQIIVQIKDTGPGIPTADQPFIFDKFFRGSNVPQGTPGSGLGLAIVKSIVESHQGRIWIDSGVELDHGSTFVVVLPTYSPDQDTKPSQHPNPEK
jgi:PAS domain S-box-containing protein